MTPGGGLTLKTLRIVIPLRPHDRAIACKGCGRQGETVVASEHQLMPQFEYLVSDEEVQNKDKSDDEPSSVSHECLAVADTERPTILARSKILYGKAPN